jgi:enoyl-CoA hydratase
MTTNQVDENDLLIEDDGFVRLLTINRPERRNALSDALKIKMMDAILTADEDPDIRVIVITGMGEDAFCAGADLKNMNQNDQAGHKYRTPMNRVERNLFELVYETKKPVIAAINGSAVAGGFELALACNLRVTHPDAKFGLPETKIGMGANFGSVVLPRLIGVTHALEMLLTGEYITANRANELGLINRLVDRSEVLPVAFSMAHAIANNAPISVRRVKAVALKGLDMPVHAALRQDPGMNPYLSEDRKEGIAARLEKRKPVWKNC